MPFPENNNTSTANNNSSSEHREGQESRPENSRSDKEREKSSADHKRNPSPNSSRPTSREISHTPVNENNKGWNYPPGLDIMATGAFWQNYSGLLQEFVTLCYICYFCYILIPPMQIEQIINFSSAPGTNGEKLFENVMKQMLPSTTGTALPSTIDSGYTTTITAKWKMKNIYDLNQVAVIAFIQNDAGKKVFGSAFETHFFISKILQ